MCGEAAGVDVGGPPARIAAILALELQLAENLELQLIPEDNMTSHKYKNTHQA